VQIKKTEIVILIIDDNSDHRAIIRRVLEAKGYIIKEASSFEEGKKLFQDFPPHLVLLDFDLKDGNGFEFMDYFSSNEHYNKIPVIMVSNINQTSVILQAISLGVKDFILKPINASLLLEKIDKYIGSYLEDRGVCINFDTSIESSKCRIGFSGNIVRLSEAGFAIVSDAYIKNSTIVKVSGSIVSEIMMEEVLKKAVRNITTNEKLRHIFKDKKHETYIAFIGIKEERKKMIKNFINRYMISKGTLR
jgi:response regulator RpfG family c-di-GMP phosphodiesterase